MNSCRKLIFVICIPVIVSVSGCGQPERKESGPAEEAGTIGSVTEVFSIASVPVEGYGVVGGLPGTGSVKCPPKIKSYLKQYILSEIVNEDVDAGRILSDPNTAAVRISGNMPTSARKNKHFDVKVEAIESTRTSSLNGGWLYSAELKREGTFGTDTRVLAFAKGPVFINMINESKIDKSKGYILGGGRVRDKYLIPLSLKQPDYALARRISDILNIRFGETTARAVSPEVIEVSIPPEYMGQKEKFISVLNAIDLNPTPEQTGQRIQRYTRQLATSDDKTAAEIALEAIGRASIESLKGLLDSSDEQVRLRAARTIVKLGEDGGVEALRQIALNKASPYRIEAIRAISSGTKRNYAAPLLRNLLKAEDFEVRLAAYEELIKFDDTSISRENIAGKFYLDQSSLGGQKEIYVARSGQPKIVIFGAPVYCRKNVYIQTPDGNVTLNAGSEEEYITLIRKLPHRPEIAKMKSTFNVSSIIRTLCEEPVIEEDSVLNPGLNVSYSEITALLKLMFDKEIIRADFHAGGLPEL